MIRFVLLGVLAASTALAAPGPSGPAGLIASDLRADLARPDLQQGTDFRSRIHRPSDGVVRVVVETDLDASALSSELAPHGAVELAFRGRVQMTANVRDVLAIASTAGVERVRYPYTPTPKAVTQGLSLMGADVYQTGGFDGSGATIGVLDVGFPDWDNLPGDLPLMSAGQVSWGPSIGGPGDNVHGTACAEIIYDLAPGATQYFANFGTSVEFDSQLQWMVDSGVDIVSASIGWDNNVPMDGTGWFAQTVDYYVAQGMLYVAAAGNEGEQYWNGSWSDGDNDGNQDFISNAYENTLLLWDNTGYPDQDLDTQINVTLRWTEAWEASGFDLDFEIYTADPGTPLSAISVLATAEEIQDGTGYPVENASYDFNVLADQAIFLRLYQAVPSQSAPTGLDVRVHAGFNLPDAYQVRAGSLATPGDSIQALTVGAVQHNDLYITSYSSEGPTEDGRTKPEVFGISHVDTESYGPWVSDPAEPGFSGTSAATPHVAAIAALLLDESPSLDAAGLRAAVISNVDTSAIQGGGDTFGSGLVNLGLPLGDDDDDAVDDDDAGDDDDTAEGGDVEPNNATGNASPTECGEGIEGRAEDVDWYELELLAPTDLSVVLNWTGGGDLDLYLYDDVLNELDRSDQVDTASEAVQEVVDPGIYFLRIEPYEGVGDYWFEPECDEDLGDDDDASDDDDDATDDDDDATEDDDDASDDDDATMALPDDDDAGPTDEGDGCQSCGSSLSGGAGFTWGLLLLIARRRR